MKLLAKVVTVPLVLVMFGAAGCSASTTAPAPASRCAGESCNGMDPAEIGCEQGALSYTKKGGYYVSMGKVEGVLEIRKGKPSVCPNIFWARFTPANANDGSFEVTLKLDGTPTSLQKSAPDNPTIVAWTTVSYVEKGRMLEACVKDAATGQEKCTDRVSAE